MAENQDKIDQLLIKLESLLKKQDDFSREIKDLQNEIENLNTARSSLETGKKAEQIKPIIEADISIKKPQDDPIVPVQKQTEQPRTKQNAPPFQRPPKGRSDVEKFIGENLINKIGIAITIIGVAIGAKYTIEHDLISPLTRIILGYLAGASLLAFGIKLKKDYKNYSAVLVSGAMAIMYFITYSAFSFYALMPQILAFVLMLVFTSFTVAAALNYNRQVIAHIGLVGAYAVPFLLSEGSGQVAILFTYMSIINIGILIIAFKKYWKPLYYSSFGLSWLMFFSWYATQYQDITHFSLALIFLSIFFSTFYLTFLAYKLVKKEKFEIDDIILLLVNSFIFYAIGYSLLNNHLNGKQLLGLFTLFNAIAHFIISVIIYGQKLADRNLFFLVSGLVMVFTTLAIPIQLDGNWVTLLWAAEAALLFWIGRTKNAPVYERLSYPLMALAFFSIIHDWTFISDSHHIQDAESRIRPIFNINFLSSVLFIAAFAFINKLNANKNFSSALRSKTAFFKLISFSIPAIFIFSIYYTFRLEIAHYWHQLYAESALTVKAEDQDFSHHYRNYDLNKYKIIWIINYSLLFVSLLAFINLRKLKNMQLGVMNIGLITLFMGVFLFQGLYVLSELRESYLDQNLALYYHRGSFNLAIRYISFVFVSLALISFYKYLRHQMLQRDFSIMFDIVLHISIIWIASSELINLMDIAQSTQSYKLGLSILWGLYSLFLIGIGIYEKKKYLRIGAFILFGITLIKLFFYDISHLNTISKTIVLVSLGVLLLIISFLYNKYKHIISDSTT